MAQPEYITTVRREGFEMPPRREYPRHIGGEFEASAVETRLNRAMGVRTVLASFSAAAAGRMVRYAG